ncbi:MAG: SUF system NifU family Fe-S cluster assembly protein [Chloroflexi bacterium]|nr:SUF system NifU family Fe-S cluster assembly protein [Chloroflexota bacterium]
MSDLRELYQEVILDHNRSPRNFRSLETANRVSEGHNPLCGDEVKVFVELDGNVITDIAFQGHGCAISKASASMMTSGVKGKTTGEAEALFEEVHRMVAGDGDTQPNADLLGRLTALAGVREFPNRVKCATLAWHTMNGALKGQKEVVFNE